nr:glycosyltransferase [Nocardioides perillae]
MAEVATVPGVRLVVVGEGPQRRWLEEHVPGVRTTGALRGGDLATAVASLDVLLVHPSPELTCAHALREAAASAVPVVGRGGRRARGPHLDTSGRRLYDQGRPGVPDRPVTGPMSHPRRVGVT